MCFSPQIVTYFFSKKMADHMFFVESDVLCGLDEEIPMVIYVASHVPPPTKEKYS